MNKEKTMFPRGATPNVWCTAEGTLIPVEELERAHIRAIVTMLLRNVFRQKLRIAYVLDLPSSGAALHKLMALPDSTFLSKYCPTWNALVNEMVERGITVNER